MSIGQSDISLPTGAMMIGTQQIGALNPPDSIGQFIRSPRCPKRYTFSRD